MLTIALCLPVWVTLLAGIRREYLTVKRMEVRS